MNKLSVHSALYLLCTLCILTSCENEIPFDAQKQEPKLIMNALLEAGEKENFVYLLASNGQEIKSVKEATVTLYINGQKTEAAEEIPLDESEWKTQSRPIPEILRRKKFRLTTELHAGDEIRLEATAEHGTLHVTAQVKVPHPIGYLQVDTAPILIKEFMGWQPYRQYKVTLQDRPGEKNHYRLDIRHDISIQGIEFGGRDTTVVQRMTEVVNYEDIVLTDGHPTSNSDENIGILIPNIENRYNVFTDSRFTNASYTLKVHTRLFQKENSIYIERRRRITKTSTVRLLSITEDEYRYLKALNCLESDNYDESLMEPVILPCNVKGGLGFVGASSEKRCVLQLPEEVFPDVNSVYSLSHKITK